MTRAVYHAYRRSIRVLNLKYLVSSVADIRTCVLDSKIGPDPTHLDVVWHPKANTC